MSLAGTFALALSLSADSFAAALGRGASAGRIGPGRVLRAGALFAAFETVSLSIGWALGYAALGALDAVDHWIAFALLLLIGGRMVHEGARGSRKVVGPAAAPPARGRLLRLAGTALATSVDAGAVGVSAAFIGFDYATTAATLAAVTFLLACVGATLGSRVGPMFGRWAEIGGGAVLIVIGANILVEHLSR